MWLRLEGLGRVLLSSLVTMETGMMETTGLVNTDENLLSRDILFDCDKQTFDFSSDPQRTFNNDNL